MLDVDRKLDFYERLTKLEYRPHEPYASARYNTSDEIIIPFSQPGEYVLPSKSYLYVEGTLSKHDRYTLAPNAIAHAFDEIKLFLNGELVDKTNYPGITSNMKAYASFSKSTVNGLHQAGWMMPSTTKAINPCVDIDSGTFSACVPLNTLMGYAEDYQQVLVNVRLELVLNRSASNANMIIPRLPPATGTASTGSPELSVKKIVWYIPYVTPSDTEKLQLLSILEKDDPITMGFRSWNLVVYPTLPTNKEISWTLKSSTDFEKPRYIIFGLKTNLQKNVEKDVTLFNHCKLTNIRLHIGSQIFPYSRMNLDFSSKRVPVLYQMYADFQRSYYSKEWSEPMLTYDEFISLAPIVVIDCSHQIESNTGSNVVDVRIDFETSEEIPANTSAYCLMLQDTIITYSPLSGVVRRGL